MQVKFLNKLEKGACILDFSCGSGRDTKYFLENGYMVEEQWISSDARPGRGEGKWLNLILRKGEVIN